VTTSQTSAGTCLACGHELLKRALALHVGSPIVGGSIRGCSSCGSAQVVPTPAPSTLAGLYSADYYESYVEGPGVAGGSKEVPPYLEKRLDELSRRFGKGRMLDFGCAEGLFVAYARDKGWESFGVETSEWAAERGRKRYGVQIFDTTLEDTPIPSASLDVVHANHVFEHLPDPVGAMRAAMRLLRPGGILVAEVPQELFIPLADRLLGLMRPAHAVPPNYHIVFFSKRGLKLAAERAGFAVERIDNLRHTEVLARRPRPFAVARNLVYRAERVLSRGPAYVLVAKRV
jgi:SAM-dependent methyltransferase